MWQAATSIVLIFGQLATLAAAPVYVCTAADGTQRLEWGDCGCDDVEMHGTAPRERWRQSALPSHDAHLTESPCHCEHRPLTNDSRLISRAEPDGRGPLSIGLADVGDRPNSSAAVGAPLSADSVPRGHTPLSDYLSICLRC